MLLHWLLRVNRPQSPLRARRELNVMPVLLRCREKQSEPSALVHQSLERVEREDMVTRGAS